MTSHSPVSSLRRSTMRSCIGRILLTPVASSRVWISPFQLILLSLRTQPREGGEGSPCGQDDAPPGARRLGCRERLPLEPSPLFLLRAHDRETTTTRWPGGSFTSPSARAGPRCRGGRRSCTRLAVQSDLFDAPINAAYRPHGQPSRPSRCPSPNPTPAFGSAPARRLLSFPIPKLAVTNFREFAHRPLPARTPTRTRRRSSQSRRAKRTP